MRHGKSLLGTLILLTGLATSPASAQQFGVAGFGGNAVGGVGAVGFNNFGGAGFNNFGGVGFGGVGFNNFGGYGYGYGYNPGFSYTTVPQTYNNIGGLMGAIRTSTGGGNSYRPGYGPAVGGRRR